MKMLLTGASGQIGQLLVPLLEARGVDLLLAGRDPAALTTVFPGRAVCGYADLAEAGKGADAVVHLAVLNNHVAAPLADFRRANVDLSVSLAAAAAAAGVPRFINISSVHALNEGDRRPYAVSKREALAALAAVPGINVSSLFLPAVRGEQRLGWRAQIDRLPNCLARGAFAVIDALVPSLDADRLADALVVAATPGTAPDNRVLGNGQPPRGPYAFAKRSIDLLAATGILLTLWWLMLIVAVIIRLESPGPAIFAQPRVGQDGRLFRCLKFRTMKSGTAQVATHMMTTSAITRVGGFLRRTKLDELPQIFNIFAGQMGLVGFRPCLPSQTELVERRQAAGVLAMMPGITGHAQVQGVDMSDPAKLVALESQYIAMQSLLLDLRIMRLTLLGQGNGDRTTIDAGHPLRR